MPTRNSTSVAMINQCFVAYTLGWDADKAVAAGVGVGRVSDLCSLDPNGRDEPVAAARNGFDKSGITGIIPKSFSDLQYRHSQALVEFDKGILRPKSIPNLFPRNNLSGAFHKQ